jgi:tyrosyl-tRNA synthetase
VQESRSRSLLPKLLRAGIAGSASAFSTQTVTAPRSSRPWPEERAKAATLSGPAWASEAVLAASRELYESSGAALPAVRDRRGGRAAMAAPPAEEETETTTEGDFQPKSEFLDRMQWRGFLHQATDLQGLDALLTEGSPVVAYLGFDATASSLHVGSLLQIMLLRHYQQSGHKPIVLVGGGTTKVGDPSGKDASRQLLSEEKIAENIAGISKVFERFLRFGDGPTDAVIVNNDDWLSSLEYLGFLREYGRYFTINRMLTFESVKQRLERESPLSFLEFNYMILQAFDFLQLARREGVRLQFGGSDQWGNIINGVELGRKTDSLQLFGFTAPLVTTSDGKKMGKTADGAVWLNADLLSPFEYWQFWRNTADADVGRFLRLFTDLPRERIEELEQRKGAAINAAKEVLADEATTLLHGEGVLEEIRATAKTLFGGSGGGSADTAALPRVGLTAEEVDAGVPLVDLFLRLELGAKSKGEVKRLVAGGGARLNGVKIEDAQQLIRREDFGDAGEAKLSSGKKKHGIIEMA